MSLFKRLFSKRPPAIPAGGHAFSCQDDLYGRSYVIRVQMPGEEPTWNCKRLYPVAGSFSSLAECDKCLSWILGEIETYEYPAGKA